MMVTGHSTGFPAVIIGFLILCVFASSCSKEKNPPRDEIPAIKIFLGELHRAIKDRDSVAIDSLMTPEASELGYSPSGILSDIYGESSGGTFYTFGQRHFLYTKNRAQVKCLILADSTDPGRPLEITLVKKADRWLLKRFDLQ
jgi:hypothetical protein